MHRKKSGYKYISKLIAKINISIYKIILKLKNC